MKICYNCNKTYSNAERYCIKCNYPLKYIPDEDYNNGIIEKYCPNCNKNYEVRRKDAVCKKCNSILKPKKDYIPKCPVCQSPNIRKLSATKRVAHGYAFGLFSNTARSQWECLNCGNKF